MLHFAQQFGMSVVKYVFHVCANVTLLKYAFELEYQDGRHVRRFIGLRGHGENEYKVEWCMLLIIVTVLIVTTIRKVDSNKTWNAKRPSIYVGVADFTNTYFCGYEPILTDSLSST